MTRNTFISSESFKLESGETLSGIEVVYHTEGYLNQSRDNVIWVCHALTANSDVSDWWPNMVGPGKTFDTENYFVICANILGSCYGSTGPLSIDKETKKPYYREFPKISVRDVVKQLDLLRQSLNIKSIHTAIGGSIGGFQALEWAIAKPGLIENLTLLATSPQVTPWASALNQSQRMAIYSDHTFFMDFPEGGLHGLKAARSIALLSYRSYEAYNLTQKDEFTNIFDRKSASYQQYQGNKLAERFNAYSYEIMTYLIDSHNIARNRGSIESVLQSIRSKTLIVAIDSDQLFKLEESYRMAQYIPNCDFHVIHSQFGHDGFLVETAKIKEILQTEIFNHTSSCITVH